MLIDLVAICVDRSLDPYVLNNIQLDVYEDVKDDLTVFLRYRMSLTVVSKVFDPNFDRGLMRK